MHPIRTIPAPRTHSLTHRRPELPIGTFDDTYNHATGRKSVVFSRFSVTRSPITVPNGLFGFSQAVKGISCSAQRPHTSSRGKIHTNVDITITLACPRITIHTYSLTHRRPKLSITRGLASAFTAISRTSPISAWAHRAPPMTGLSSHDAIFGLRSLLRGLLHCCGYDRRAKHR